MEKENKQIELRSEKVRNIIGQIPSVLLQYGITIIGLSLLVLLGVSSFIPYQPSINTDISVTQWQDGSLHFSAVIPQNAVKKQEYLAEVLTDPSSDLPLPARFQIKNISDTVQFSGSKAWCAATLIPMENVSEIIRLESTVVIPAKVMLKKKSVLLWVLEKSKGV